MKKHLHRLLAWGIVLTMFFAAANPAMATSLTTDSNAEVEFITATTDALYLKTVPVLDFGSRELQVTDWYYAAIATTNPLEVHDRRGTASGWNVTVSLEEFKDSTSTVGLQAAEITYKALTAYTGVTITGVLAGSAGITGPMATAPGAIPAATTATVTAAATPVPVKVFTAPSGTGVGMWAAHWMADASNSEGAASTGADVELLVKAGTAAAEVYTAKMNWVLADTP